MAGQTALCWAIVVSAAAPAGRAEVRFEKVVIDRAFRSEGVAAADVNNDGLVDVLVGDLWYEAPGWKAHEIRAPGSYDVKGYSKCFACFAQDVNGDGWADCIVVGFPGESALWYENPKGGPGRWKERQVTRSACNETPCFADLLGTRRPVLVFGVEPEKILAWFSVPARLDSPWDMHPISAPGCEAAARFAHGLGVGDMNRDGRLDVLAAGGWWEAPADRAQKEWRFHKAEIPGGCSDILVLDADGDGDADLVAGSAHDYGLWWFEQTQPGRFTRHVISTGFSQVHALALADVNRDGLPDFVTGKRFYAHVHDPGAEDPCVLYWYELRRAGGKAQFVEHLIDNDSGVGTQFQVADVNADGRLDIVTSNKKGVCVFIQR